MSIALLELMLQKMDHMQQELSEALINIVLKKGTFKELTETTNISDGYSYVQSSSSSTVTPSPLTLPESDVRQSYEDLGLGPNYTGWCRYLLSVPVPPCSKIK